jgi:thiol-disulfide isomerase/thioredoxin
MFGSATSLRMMMVLLIFGFIVTWAPVQEILADQPDKPAELPIDRGLMQRLSNFSLKDVKSGRTHTLYGYQGRKAIVLVFLGNECPVGSLYVPRLNEINTEYRKKGVVFLGINSNAHETDKDVAKYVADRGIEFPVLKDP